MEVIVLIIILLSLFSLGTFALIKGVDFYASDQKKLQAEYKFKAEILSQKLSIVFSSSNFSVKQFANDSHIRGTISGREIYIRLLRNLVQSQEKLLTVISISCHNPQKAKFSLRESRFLNEIGAAFMGGDKRIGDEGFDDRFSLSCKNTG